MRDSTLIRRYVLLSINRILYKLSFIYFKNTDREGKWCLFKCVLNEVPVIKCNQNACKYPYQCPFRLCWMIWSVGIIVNLRDVIYDKNRLMSKCTLEKL